VIDFAAVLVLLAAVLWAAYAVASKHVVLGVHPIPMFTGVAVFTTLFFVPLSLVFGEPETIVTAGTFLTFVAFLSGVVPIALAHSSYNAAQKQLGSAFCSSFIIVLPLFTYLQGKLVLEDERVTAVQWAGAAILLSGTFLVTRAGVLVHRRDSQGAAAHVPRDP
jgi:drug/metabolite transporter (DMT)-like permease